MIRNALIVLALLLWLTGATTAVRGQALDQYVKGLNSLVPVTPEAAGIMKYTDFPVSLFTGTPQVSIPIYSIKAKGIEVPIALSYHAGGGVKVDEPSGNCGLGFMIVAGGEITRETRGAPDEGGGSGSAAGYFNNPHPISWYKDQIETVNTEEGDASSHTQIAFDAASGTLDLEPDIFYFSFGNYSGKFVYNEETDQFECLVQQPFVISMQQSAGTINSWKIVTDDGTQYYFDQRVTTASKSECASVYAAANYGVPVTTSWKLSKIVNADATDSIMLSYSFGMYNTYTSGSSTTYRLLELPAPLHPRQNMNCYTNSQLSGRLYLDKIYSNTDSVIFQRETTERLDQPGDYALSRIIINPDKPAAKQIFKFNYDYFNRSGFVGAQGNIPTTMISKSLKLTGLTNYGNSETNPYPLNWNFTYNNTTLPWRLSYSQDFWGYANTNSYPSLAPKQIIYLQGGPINVDGADRNPDPNKVYAGILEKIQYPTGGTTTFEYEPNDIGYPEEFTTGNTLSINQLMIAFKGANETFSAFTPLEFDILQPPDPSVNLNSPDSGVIANISVFPKDTAFNINPTKVYFELEGPSGMLLNKSIQNKLLKNGHYKMKIHNESALNTSEYINTIRNISFSVSYKVLDTTVQAINYICGGLRIKRITSSDGLYGGVPVIREFSYHNPVNDSSYGKFMANTLHNYEEVFYGDGGGLTAGAYFYYTVNVGHCIKPGSYAGSVVVYPKVIEIVRNGSKMYKTEHEYSNSAPPAFLSFFPYPPPEDTIANRGNLLSTVLKEDRGNNNYVDVKKTISHYDFEPVSQFTNPGTPLAGRIRGIKSSFPGYNELGNGDIIIWPYAKTYTTTASRALVQSDTTITYDSLGATIKEWNSYVYGDYNQKPVSVTTGSSEGINYLTKNWYFNGEGPNASSEMNSTVSAQMVAKNRVNSPAGTEQYKAGQLLSRMFTYGHMNGNQLLTDSLRQAAFSNPLDKEIEVRSYDDNANPTAIRLRGEKYRRYTWNTDKNLATASCVMSQNGLFVFTSFEEENEPGINSNGRMAGNAFSGTYAYDPNQGGDLSFGNFSSDAGLEVYVWATGAPGTHVKLNGEEMISTGRTKGSWTLYKGTAGGNGSVSIGGNMLIDQLAILPVGSDFDGNVYDNAQRIIAKVNGNMQTAFFEYDSFGRLKLVRDEQGNIVKQNDYQYQGPQ